MLDEDFIKCQLTDASYKMSQQPKNTLRSRLPRFNFLKKTPKKGPESKIDKDLANFVEKVNSSRKNSTTDVSLKSSVISAKDRQNINVKLR